MSESRSTAPLGWSIRLEQRPSGTDHRDGIVLEDCESEYARGDISVFDVALEVFLDEEFDFNGRWSVRQTANRDQGIEANPLDLTIVEVESTAEWRA